MSTPKPATPDERQLAGVAHKISADLMGAKPWIYWADLVATAVVAYGGFTLAVVLPGTAQQVVAGLVSLLAFYRGISFIHELTHLRPGDVPGFRAGWNALIGVPFLVPSFMYDGVHNLHHAKSRYGTVQDPEYFPLARMTPFHLIGFVAVSALAPVALLFRFTVLVPLAAVIPAVRRLLVERCSALAINPQFKRDAVPASQHRLWIILEALGSAWAWTFLSFFLTGFAPWRVFGIAMAIGAGVAVVNQLRTLAAHLWENEGDEMSFTDQFLDSVNVPPPAMLPMIWAPVGLRYHALHHLLPRLPYHNLGRAHARLAQELPETSPYHRTNGRSLTGLMAQLFRKTSGSQAIPGKVRA